jgi:hypothetical protein
MLLQTPTLKPCTAETEKRSCSTSHGKGDVSETWKLHKLNCTVSISKVCMAIVLIVFNGGIRKYDTWLSIGGVATILFP